MGFLSLDLVILLLLLVVWRLLGLLDTVCVAISQLVAWVLHMGQVASVLAWLGTAVVIGLATMALMVHWHHLLLIQMLRRHLVAMWWLLHRWMLWQRVSLLTTSWHELSRVFHVRI